ncbi:glycosyltransferase [Photobacterium carnosum]|uniref:glycosyltransferase family 4 protein n=1 Tax=Photobacterium carnosum TaxID=2023717 RepID=UPI001E3A5143|nr:glycosyltransferase family 4 protein [Photobacterium carnosum]MCD9544466.1 glycosyltransferase [Photobacterium carnosum]
MNIAFVITSLANKGPVIVIKDIIDNLPMSWNVSIFYFDEIKEINFSSKVKLIKVDSFFSRINFENYDIVHSHLLRPDLFCFINRSTIQRHISTLHSDMENDLKMSHGKIISVFISYLWKSVLLFSDKVVFLTNTQRKKYNFIKNYSVIYNGRPVLTDDISMDKQILEIKKDNSTCIFLGACANIVKRKGFNQVIDLLTYKGGDKYFFILVGDGPELENIKSYAKNKKVYSRCIFIEKTHDVNKFLSVFDIFIMTSHSEGMPLSLLEAASHSLPIVCSSLDVVKEVFSNDEISFYNYGDIESLSLAVEKAVNNSDTLSKNINMKFSKDYTDIVMSEKYQKLYINIVNK